MNLTQTQQALLLGTVLGDAYLQKTGEKNARLRLEHSRAQEQYLVWKASHFPRLFQGAPERISREHPLSQKTYHYTRFQSNSSPELGKWRTILYENGKKCIPKNLEALLVHPLALAVWYMDDGYFYEKDHNSYIYLGTVTEGEAKIAQKAIEQNFGIKGVVYDKKRKGFALFFGVKETQALHALLAPHMFLPFFNYKLVAAQHSS